MNDTRNLDNSGLICNICNYRSYVKDYFLYDILCRTKRVLLLEELLMAAQAAAFATASAHMQEDWSEQFPQTSLILAQLFSDAKFVTKTHILFLYKEDEFQKSSCKKRGVAFRQNHPCKNNKEPENDGLEDVVSYWNSPFSGDNHLRIPN